MTRVGTSGAIVLCCALLGAGCEPERTQPPPSECTADQCRDVSGACVQGNTPFNCGSGGSCALCQSNQTCVAGQCVIGGGETCGPSTCPTGCCQGNQCISNPTSQACGTGGGACIACSPRQQCEAGGCRSSSDCGPGLCDGCCHEGQCYPGESFGLCGSGGQACQSCPPGKKCENKTCVQASCDPGSCAGCCDANGQCATGDQQSNCGAGGVACQACSADATCTAGKCETVSIQCTPANCPGCCDSSGKCVPGNTNADCGTGGGSCDSCGSSQQCVSNKCTCTSTSCAGCCEGDVCKGGTANDACGAGGKTCQQCLGSQSCATSGSCEDQCSGGTCAGGCCDGNKCNLAGPNDSTACGTGGNPCTPCTNGATCSNGTCNNPATCSPSSCPTGCCKDGQCQQGTSNGACGGDGEVCDQCPTWSYCHQGTSTRFCHANDNSKWKVTLASIVLDSSIIWDTSTNPPDVYVIVTTGAQTKQSKEVADTYTPLFNEYLLTASGSDLKTAIKFVIWDNDWWPNPDEKILECDDMIYADEFRQGYALIKYPCGNSSSNPVKSIRFDLALASP